MVVSETRQFDDTIKKYEKDAMERVLDFFSQTSGRVDWFEDCDVLITHLRDNLSAQPFCDFLRMYLYETCQLKEQYPSCNAVPDSRYYREFTARFAANGMANIASIDPDKPHALDHRFVYRLFRKERIGRDVAFLLAFGLGMDDDAVGKLITRIIRESSYNFKDPREAIYFYCLRNRLGYSGVVRFLEIYKQLTPMESRFTRESHTYEYEQCFRSVRNEEEFIELLADVKAAEGRFRGPAGYVQEADFLHQRGLYRHAAEQQQHVRHQQRRGHLPLPGGEVHLLPGYAQRGQQHAAELPQQPE